MKQMQNLILLAFLIYSVVVLGLYIFQRQLIYHPDKNIKAPKDYGLETCGEHIIMTPDHEKVQLWYCKAAEGMPTIAYFHGNSYHLGERAKLFKALIGRGFGLAAVSYRGFGKSTGEPDEQGLYIDARATIHFLLDEAKISISNIMLFGESLGTGVATQMATEFNVGALILQAPYTSVAHRAAEIYFYVPVPLLIKDQFATISKIGRVKAPLLVFHGERDDTIPIRQGRQVFETARAPKQAFFFPQFGHSDFDSELLSAHVLDFARTHGLILSPHLDG